MFAGAIVAVYTAHLKVKWNCRPASYCASYITRSHSDAHTYSRFSLNAIDFGCHSVVQLQFGRPHDVVWKYHLERSTVRLMRSVCNFQSKSLLQHHRTINICVPFVIFNPKFYNIIDRTHSIRLYSSIQDFTTSSHHHPSIVAAKLRNFFARY